MSEDRLHPHESSFYVYCASHKKIVSSVSDKKAERTLFDAQIRFNPFGLDSLSPKLIFLHLILSSISIRPFYLFSSSSFPAAGFHYIFLLRFSLL